MEEAKRPFFVVTSAADTSISDNEVVGDVGEAANSDPSSAVITITMYAVADE